MIEHELETVRSIFLSEVDEEVRADNEEMIRQWERGLRENRAYANWQEFDITKNILAQVRLRYIEVSLVLAHDRTLDDKARNHLWAIQDAASWIISLMARDANAEIAAIEGEIRHAIAATK